MRHFLLLAALLSVSGALLPGCVDSDGDGIPDSPPGSVGDDDDAVVGDDDDSVEIVTLPLEVSTGSCGVSLSGEDLQVAVSHPEARGDEWSTPVPPRVSVPADGQWWRVEVYSVGFTLAETFVRLDGSDAFQSETPDGEGGLVTSVAVAMHYNFSSLCGDAQEYGNAQCSPSVGGGRWWLDFNFFGSGEFSLTMGVYTPQSQNINGFGGWEAAVNGCTVEITDSSGTYELSVLPATGEVAGDIEGLDVNGYSL